MQLNRCGFGLGAAICFCCFLGFCLLLSAFSYREMIEGKPVISFSFKSSHSSKVPYRMKNDYSGISIPRSNSDEYSKLEARLKQMAQTYMQNNFNASENKIVITLRTLQSKKIIDSLYDSSGNLCNGYVIYDSILNLYTPYLRCGTYKSVDYVNRLE